MHEKGRNDTSWEGSRDVLCDGSYSYRLALRVVLKATSGHRASVLTPELPEVV